MSIYTPRRSLHFSLLQSSPTLQISYQLQDLNNKSYQVSNSRRSLILSQHINMSLSRALSRQSASSRSDDRSHQASRTIRDQLPMLSIHEDEPSRYDSRAPTETKYSQTGDRGQSRASTSSRFDSQPPSQSRITSMGDYPQSKASTASRYESRAPQDSRASTTSDRTQTRTPTYMDPSKPMVIDCAPKSRQPSRTSSSSQMTVTDPSQTVVGRSRDSDRRDASYAYEEEITIRMTRKVYQRSSHRS